MANRYSNYAGRPEYYDSSAGAAFGNFAEGLVGGIEKAYLSKQLKKEKEEERKQKELEAKMSARLKAESEGWTQLAPSEVYGPNQPGEKLFTPGHYTETSNIGGVPFKKEPTQGAIQLKVAELEKIQAETKKAGAESKKEKKTTLEKIQALEKMYQDPDSKEILTQSMPPATKRMYEHLYNKMLEEEGLGQVPPQEPLMTGGSRGARAGILGGGLIPQAPQVPQAPRVPQVASPMGANIIPPKLPSRELPSGKLPSGNGQQITPDIVQKYLEVYGTPEKAREEARKAGWVF